MDREMDRDQTTRDLFPALVVQLCRETSGTLQLMNRILLLTRLQQLQALCYVCLLAARCNPRSLLFLVPVLFYNIQRL